MCTSNLIFSNNFFFRKRIRWCLSIQNYCVSDPSSCYNATVHGAGLKIDSSSLDGVSATHNIEFLMGMDQMSITLYPTPILNHVSWLYFSKPQVHSIPWFSRQAQRTIDNTTLNLNQYVTIQLLCL